MQRRCLRAIRSEVHITDVGNRLQGGDPIDKQVDILEAPFQATDLESRSVGGVAIGPRVMPVFQRLCGWLGHNDRFDAEAFKQRK